MRRTFCVLAGLLLVALELFGQIPRTISYQGVLCDAKGMPKPDNSYQMTFRLYEMETGGTAIWTDTKSLTVKRGLFNTLLGPFSSSITFDKPCWLGIQLEGEAELSPRIALSSVGYSFSAVNADTADYAASIKDGTVTTAKISDGAVTGGKVASGQVVKSINALKDDVTLAAGSNVSITPSGNTLTISASGGGAGTVTGSGSSGQMTFWTGTSSIGGDNGLFWDNSSKRLGIGTTSPSYPVHVRSTADWVVVGEATASSGETWGGVFFSPNNSTGRGVYGGGNAIGVYGNSPATAGTNYGVYGTSNSTDGTGVRGYAQSSTGNTRGISGESVSSDGIGVYGAASGTGTAVYAESKGGGPAIRTVGGDVFVSGGAFRGDIGPNGGAPFPRPAYTSGWSGGGSSVPGDAAAGFQHNLGGDPADYVVQIQLMVASAADPTTYHFAGPTGGRTQSWYITCTDLTSAAVHIELHKNGVEPYNYKMRVRIWVVK